MNTFIQRTRRVNGTLPSTRQKDVRVTHVRGTAVLPHRILECIPNTQWNVFPTDDTVAPYVAIKKNQTCNSTCMRCEGYDASWGGGRGNNRGGGGNNRGGIENNRGGIENNRGGIENNREGNNWGGRGNNSGGRGNYRRDNRDGRGSNRDGQRNDRGGQGGNDRIGTPIPMIYHQL
ncbi:uncharacterized protein DDB_G0290685-like [Ctenocephalides felis]|uniref:uncharacterized protein DDB_G0290685-like n=1 Tax=Ctenocephalides felis TaxID=7515 RepID=UPI000E6E252D|nr:uncharacterized protein DDB_G0290685-like [Ctenocephalides felis]